MILRMCQYLPVTRFAPRSWLRKMLRLWLSETVGIDNSWSRITLLNTKTTSYLYTPCPHMINYIYAVIRERNHKFAKCVIMFPPWPILSKYSGQSHWCKIMFPHIMGDYNAIMSPCHGWSHCHNVSNIVVEHYTTINLVVFTVPWFLHVTAHACTIMSTYHDHSSLSQCPHVIITTPQCPHVPNHRAGTAAPPLSWPIPRGCAPWAGWRRWRSWWSGQWRRGCLPWWTSGRGVPRSCTSCWSPHPLMPWTWPAGTRGRPRWDAPRPA